MAFSADCYFDNAASSPLAPEVFEAMRPWLTEHFGNASSVHSLGLDAKDAVEKAREQIAALIGVDPQQIFFTSGATESNQWVMRAFESVCVSPFEHSSIHNTAIHRGFDFFPNDGLEIIPDPDRSYELVSLTTVSNEIGTVFKPSRLAGLGQVHSDITQAVGKVPLDLKFVDFASFSAHKFYGPKGVGALYASTFPPEPLLIGEQENRFRGGTLNVPGIVGMGAAAALTAEKQQEDHEFVTKLRSIVIDEISGIPDHTVNGGPDASPYILSCSFAGVTGETLVIDLDNLGFALSSGPACSSGSMEPSHVLKALDYPDDLLRGTVRISFGRYSSIDKTHEMSVALKQTVKTLRTMIKKT